MKATDIKLNTEIYAIAKNKEGSNWEKGLVLAIGTGSLKGSAKVVTTKSHWSMSDTEKALTKSGVNIWDTTNPMWVRLATIKDTATNWTATREKAIADEKIAREKRAEANANQETFRKSVIADWNNNPTLNKIASGYSIDSYYIPMGGKFSEGRNIVKMNHSQLLAVINYINELEQTIIRLERGEN